MSGQRRPQGLLFTGSAALNTSVVPEASGRLSDAHQISAAALERKELLKQYQAQKAAAKAAAGKPGGGVPLPGGSAGSASSDDPAFARRASTGIPRPAPRPPMPAAGANNRLSGVGVPANATQQPTGLLTSDEGDLGMLSPSRLPQGPARPANPALNTDLPQMPPQRNRLSSGHELLMSKNPPLATGRFSLGGGGAPPTTGARGSAATPAGPGPYGPRNTSLGPAGLSMSMGVGGGSLGPMGAGSMSGGMSGGGVSGAGLDTKGEIRALRLQELQWRYVNARMVNAMQARAQQGEQALAACVLTISQLERATAAVAAQHARQQLVQRAEQMAQSFKPILESFIEMQSHPDSPDSVLQHIAQGLLHSLTCVPLIAGAVCGDPRYADLESLEHSMNRASEVLNQMDASLQSLLSGRVKRGALAGAAAASLSAVDTSAAAGAAAASADATAAAAQQDTLPVAAVLEQLVSHLKSEVACLATIQRLTTQLSNKQLQLNSYQVQLMQMARRQQVACA